MELTGTKTLINLARAFAGESQARTRYVIYAEKAGKEGFAYIAKILESIAAQELSHAKVFLDHICRGCREPMANIRIDAGYPFEFGATLANLQASSKAEDEEASRIYPAFAQAAYDEGFAPIARSFELISKVEAEHSKLETALHTALAGGKLYQADQPVVWCCANCGHEATAAEPWITCPLCNHPQGFVIPQAAMQAL